MTRIRKEKGVITRALLTFQFEVSEVRLAFLSIRNPDGKNVTAKDIDPYTRNVSEPFR